MRYRVGRLSALLVDQYPGFGFRCGSPPITPAPKGEKDVEEILASRGEHILPARGMILVGPGFEDASMHQSIQAIGEDIAGDAQVALEIVKSPHPHEGIAEHEQCPVITDDVQSVRNRALEVVERLPSRHSHIVIKWVASCNGLC